MKYKNTSFIIVAIVIMLLGGWYFFAKKPADKNNIASEKKLDSPDMILDMKKWTWIKTVYSDNTELVPKEAEEFTLTFKNDGTFSATTDCDSISGTYETNNNQITFGQNLISTRMFCEGSQEQEFLAMLMEIQSFLFTSQSELIFQLKLESGSSIFH